MNIKRRDQRVEPLASFSSAFALDLGMNRAPVQSSTRMVTARGCESMSATSAIAPMAIRASATLANDASRAVEEFDSELHGRARAARLHSRPNMETLVRLRVTPNWHPRLKSRVRPECRDSKRKRGRYEPDDLMQSMRSNDCPHCGAAHNRTSVVALGLVIVLVISVLYVLSQRYC
jgi:hypothetical protein